MKLSGSWDVSQAEDELTCKAISDPEQWKRNIIGNVSLEGAFAHERALNADFDLRQICPWRVLECVEQQRAN